MIRIDKSALLPALAHVAGCADARAATVSATACVRILAGDGRLVLTATDYDVSAEAVADCDGDLALLALAAKLLAVVRGLPDGATVTLSQPLSEHGSQLRIEAGRSRYHLATLDADQFPEVDWPETDGQPLDAASWQALLAGAHCISGDDSRPAITGALLVAEGGKLSAVATDGHRLGMASVAFGGALAPVIVHRRAVGELKRFAESGHVSVAVSGRNVVFSKGGQRLMCRAIEANFPDYRKVVPAKGDGSSVVVNRAALLAELARVSALGSKGEPILRLSLGPDASLCLDMATADVGNSHSEVEFEGVWTCDEIGVNPAFLRDALAAVQGDFATLQVKDSLTPVMVTGDNDGAQVCMPMRL